MLLITFLIGSRTITKGQYTMNITIKSTINYDQFELHDMNRRVIEGSRHFKSILKSMEQYGFISGFPIVCEKNGSGRLKIKAGHNRFRAAQKLGIPVKYVVDNTPIPIVELEQASRGWSIQDYFFSYCKQGIKPYLELQDYIERTGISLSNAASMFFGNTAGSGNFNEQFKRGDFQIKDRSHPAIVGDLIMHMKKHGIDWAHDARTVMAISRCAKIREFNVSRFKKKVAAHPHLFEKQKNLQDALQMVEDIYNHASNRKDREPIAFLATQAATERSISFKWGYSGTKQ